MRERVKVQSVQFVDRFDSLDRGDTVTISRDKAFSTKFKYQFEVPNLSTKLTSVSVSWIPAEKKLIRTPTEYITLNGLSGQQDAKQKSYGQAARRQEENGPQERR